MVGKVTPETGVKLNIVNKISLAGEMQSYAGLIRQHWALILSIGLLFGWLLSFPMQGPLLVNLTAEGNANLQVLITAFLSGHIIGLLAGGIEGYYSRRNLIWLSLGGIPCLVLSMSITAFPTEVWWLIFLLLGLFAGNAVTAWGGLFSAAVLPHLRGRTFILGAILANLILYLVSNLNNIGFDLSWLLRAVSILPLGLTVILIFRYRKAEQNTRPAPVNEILDLRASIAGHWPVMPFIFAIYAVGGIMYAVVGALSSPPDSNLVYFALVPYILFLLAAGSLADRFGRRAAAITGAVMVGAGFMLVVLLEGPLQFFSNQIFLVGSYAFLDTFTWTMAADLAIKRKAAFYYSIIISINVLAILLGVVLSEKMGEWAGEEPTLTVSLAGLFAFISLGLVFRLGETLPAAAAVQASLDLDLLNNFAEEKGFTSRELDIARLLIAGAATPEILEKLVITPNTLKSHLRNIYRKSGARNRLEFTMAVIKNKKENTPK